MELIQRFLLGLASLVPLEAATAAATPDDGPHKGDAPVNPVVGHLQVFVGLVDGRYFVGAEGAQQQRQEQIQHLRDDEIITSDEGNSEKNPKKTMNCIKGYGKGRIMNWGNVPQGFQ